MKISFEKILDNTTLCRWIQAKAVLLTSEEHGEDMTSVNTLLKTHLDILLELETLSEKVEKLEQDAEILSQTHPERAEEVGKFSGMFWILNKLCQNSQTKNLNLIINLRKMNSGFVSVAI